MVPWAFGAGILEARSKIRVRIQNKNILTPGAGRASFVVVAILTKKGKSET